MKRIYNWREIQRYYDAGNGFKKCQQTFGVTHYSWTKAIQRGELEARLTQFRWPRRHDWSSIQAYYDEGYSIRACCQHFGFSPAAWKKAQDRGEVKARALGMSIDRLLSSNKRARGHVKVRLIRAGLLTNRCEECGITEWLGKRLTMQLDHINGVKNDHRLVNLRMLCPNCHSQTDTFSGKNFRRRRLQEAACAM